MLCGRHAMYQVLRLLCSTILAAAIAGCANTPKSKGMPWWPQGPGNTAHDVLRTSDAEAAGNSHESLSSSTQPEYRDAQAVRYGGLLFVEAQVRSAMDNVVHILESHGLSISNIVSVTLYLQDIADLPRADAIYAAYFRRGLPARSVVGIDGLPNGSLVEIAVIAGK
jgi:endoribonuclease L-PSP